jgi:hypothetical protein
MAKAVCPKCGKVSMVADQFAGRKMVCKICETAFVVPASVNVAPAGITAAAAVTPAPRQTSGGVITVVARRVGQGKDTMLADGTPAAGPSTLSWVVLALVGGLALLLPVLGAGAFVAINLLTHGGQGGIAGASQPGELYGGIEIASSGVKATVIELYQDPKYGYDYHKLLQTSRDTRVTLNMEKTGQFDREALADTVSTVQDYFDQILKEHHVPRENVFIVGGSGLFKAVRERKDLDDDAKDKLILKNQAAITEPVAKVTGKTMDFIDVRQEVKMMITGLLGKRDASRSVFIDVGNSGTRGGYREQDGAYVTFEGPGVGKIEGLLKTAATKPKDYCTTAGGLADKEMREPLQKALERKAGLLNRDAVYLNGGIVWVMATFMHPEDREVYTKLSAQDIDAFHDLVCQNPDEFPKVTFPAGIDPKIRSEAEAEVAKQKDIFKPIRLIAGAEVLRAVSAEFRLQKKDLYFTRDAGDVGWLLAYISNKGAAGK